MKMEPFVAIPSDQSEPTKTNNMRRISSILKAPRTPLKSIGGEDGCQDCTNKPFEKKRRSSRRVSFAQTNNIKDFKNDSPVTKLLGDLDGTEMEDLDKEKLNADQDGKPQLLGMETLLNAPLQVPQQQNKERSFFEHGTMDTVADKTVVFSEEDNANMDMTYSHTILISKDDDDINDVANCGNLDVGEFISRLDKNKNVGNADSRREYSYFSRCEDSTIFGNNSVKTSDFKNGLAKSAGQSGNRRFFSDLSSLTPLVQQNSVPPGPEKICSKDFLSRLKSHGSGFDKEKQASVLTERFDLQFINKTVLVDKEDNMDMTKSHTISIDTRTINENKCVIHPAEPDDMDMTKSQTVNTAYKEVMASDPFRVIPPKTRKLVAGLAGCSNETVVFSEELNEMDMTKSHTVAIDTKSILNASEKPLDFCHNALASCGLSLRPDYKDMTKSQTNSLDYKTNAALTNPAKDINKACRSVLGFSVPADKTVLFSVDKDDMDMTKSHTVAIDNRSLLGQKREQNNKLVDMEMTRSQIAAIDCKTIEVTDPLMAMQTKPRSNASFSAPYDRTVVFPEYFAEMEMTQSHTVSIDSTNILMAREKSEMCFSESRLPCSPSFTSVPKDMELAKGQTVKSDFKTTLAENSTSEKRKSKQSIFSLSVPADGTVVCSGEYDDMDMTKSHTVAIDCKSIIREIDNPMQSLNNNVPSTLRSVINNADEMELTKSQTVFGMFEKSKKNQIGLSIPSDKTIFFPVDQDEMNMTKSHTVSIDSRSLYEQNVEQNDMEIMKSQPAAVDSNNIEDDRFMGIPTKLRPNMTVFSALPDKTVFFSEDIAEMDMTKSHTVAIDRSYILPAASKAIARDKTGMLVSKSILPSSHLSTSEADDMELTKSQTAKIDFKTTAADRFVPKCNIRSGRSVLGFPVPADITVMFSGGYDDMDMTKSHTMAIETSSHFEQNEESDDMEMTRSQTVAIDWKNIEATDPVMGIPAKPKCNATSLLAPSDRTVLFSEDLTEMEMTKSHTVAINSTNLLPESEKRPREKSGMLLSESILPHSHFSTSEPDDMELTKSQTVKIDFKTTAAESFAPKSNIRSRSVLGLSVPADRTVMFSGENDDMEMTRSQTVAIHCKNLEEADPFMGIQAKPKRNVTSLLAPSDRTVLFSEDLAEMEITKSHTVAINSSNLLPESEKRAREKSGMLLSESILPHSHFSTSEPDDMELTKSQTVKIDFKTTAAESFAPKSNIRSRSVLGLSVPADRTVMFSGENDDMEMTRSQTVAIHCKNLEEADPFMGIQAKPKRNTTSLLAPSDRTLVFSEDFAEMEITKSHTVDIDSSNILPTNDKIGSDESGMFLSVSADRTVVFSGDCDDMDMTKSHTVVIDKRKVKEVGEDCMQSVPNSVQLNSEMSAAIKITRSQTSAVDCRPVEANSFIGIRQRPRKSVTFSSLPTDKTVVFSEDRNEMDMTKSNTVVIESNFFQNNANVQYLLKSDTEKTKNQTIANDVKSSIEINHPNAQGNKRFKQSVPRLCAPVDKTTLLTDDQDEMDTTKGHTLAVRSSKLFTQREKTTDAFNNSILRVDCSVLDQQNMDITRSQTVFIDCSTNPAAGHSTKSKQCVAALSMSEKNIEFSKQCDDTDMARSHTLATESRRPFEQVPRLQFQDDIQIIGNQTVTIGHQNSEIVNPLIKSKSASDESVPIKTITFSKGENLMEITKGQEVAIKGRSPVQGSERDVESQEMSVQCMSTAIKPDIFSSSDKPALGMSVVVDGLATEKTLSDSLFCFEPQNVNKLDEERGSEDKSNCFGLNNQEVKRESIPFIVSDFNLESREQMKKADLTELTCEINRTVEESGELSLQNSEAINEAVKMANRRRRSLVDLQSKLKNIKNMINKSETGMTCHTAPLPKLIKLSETETEDKCVKDSFPRNECNNPNAADNGEVHFAVSEEPNNLQCNDNSSHVDLTRNMTTPVNFCYDKPQKASMPFGGFLPKLPQKKKILNSKTLNCAQSGHFGKLLINAVTSDTAIQQGNNDPVQNIDEEILPYYTDEEDSAENMNCEFPAENCDKENAVETVETDVGVNDSGFDKPVLNQTPSQKRPLQEDGHEDIMVHERKIKRSPDVPSANQEKEARVCRVQWSSSALGITAEILPSGTMTKTFDTTSGSSNSMNLKAEATFDSSAQRCSRFESQFLEEVEDLQEKLQDGSITAKEFLQLLDVYMHIQRPRQSTLPHNVASDSAPKTEVLLKEKYIYRPQQQVYEEDCQALTETVDKLKTRICDQEKTLKSMNESLWLTVKSYSKEQLRSLAFKLNEKKIQFRKNVKAYFHETKIDSYSKLVQCAQAAQQDLKEKINLTEGLLQNLNECFHNLEAELAGLDCSEMEEENVNPELELTLKTRQEELENLNAEGADCERKLFELVTENKQLETEVCKLQVKTQELELFIQDLNRLSEWTLTQWLDGRAVFTFLNGSLELELVFEAPHDKTHSSEKAVLNILAINFYTLLDDERAHPSSLVIHSLINQFINSKESWCKKYSTQYDIPKLLHDFSIVVSHLRLLGQELRYLKKWGPLKFDILEMTLLDTHVKILFSSVKGFAKFEITLALTPAYPFSRLVLLDFKNYIGNFRWEQIEEVLCAVQPENNYLTRIVEKIHLNLLTKHSVHF